MTLTDPPGETTHWTGAIMAEAIGISVSSVQRIWRAHGLQPHRVRQFKLSNDPKFIDKLRDVVGLYVDPPAHAIALSVDEKSQIQALDRTQPGLPLKQGRAGTMTHDYKRHGHHNAVCCPKCARRNRDLTQYAAPSSSGVYPLPQCDRGRSAGRQGRACDPRQLRRPQASQCASMAQSSRALHIDFTPTSCSWLNAVEGFFAKLTKRRLKRAVFVSVADLQAAINRFVVEHNTKPKPFTWTADPDKIIRAVRRGHQVLVNSLRHDHLQPGSPKPRMLPRTISPSTHTLRRGAKAAP